MRFIYLFYFTSSTAISVINVVLSVPHIGMGEGKSEPFVVFPSTESYSGRSLTVLA
jgi:hypothetical protein